MDSEQIAEAHGVLTPNGGSSIKDTVNQLKTTVAQLATRQLARMNLDSSPIFEADSAGSLVWVNRAFLHLLGATEAEVLGRGWRNYLADDATWNAWQAAVADQRDFRCCFKVRKTDGEKVNVCVEALAAKGEGGEFKGYVGNVCGGG